MGLEASGPVTSLSERRRTVHDEYFDEYQSEKKSNQLIMLLMSLPTSSLYRTKDG